MNLNHIKLIAYNERILLRRNLIFTIFTLFIIGSILNFHIYTYGDWKILQPRINIPSVIPFTDICLFSYLQALAIIFLTGYLIHDKIAFNIDLYKTQNLNL